MNKNDLTTKTQELIAQVEEKFPAGVEIEFKEPKKVGYLRHDQAQHRLDRRRGGGAVLPGLQRRRGRDQG